MQSNNSSNVSSPTSQNERIWELTEYDVQRTPHKPLHPDQLIECRPKSILGDVTCPICLDILKNTMTTKECLHRFCSKCITTAIRSGNKECPSCRKKLVSKRSLRRDHDFDNIINCLFPNRADLEDFQNRLAGSPQRDDIFTSERMGRIRSHSSIDEAQPSISRDESSYDDFDEICNFNIVLTPHLDEQGKVRNMRTQPNITVEHLMSFLAIKYRKNQNTLESEGSAVGQQNPADKISSNITKDKPEFKLYVKMLSDDGSEKKLVELTDHSETAESIAERFGKQKAAVTSDGHVSCSEESDETKVNTLFLYYEMK